MADQHTSQTALWLCSVNDNENNDTMSSRCHPSSALSLLVKQWHFKRATGRENKTTFLIQLTSQGLPESLTPPTSISPHQPNTDRCLPSRTRSSLFFWICVFCLLLADSVLHHPVKIHICWTWGVETVGNQSFVLGQINTRHNQREKERQRGGRKRAEKRASSSHPGCDG